jgi:hypothetical protein
MIKNLNAGLFEQGKIKIGGKGKEKTSGSGKTYREALKLDHFVVTTLERDTTKEENFKIDTEAMKGLPKKPTSLPIELLYDDIELNFPTCFSMFNNTGIFCRGDGETASREGKEISCNIDTCPYFKKSSCKISGILMCRLPHTKNLMGIYKFRTHSWNSVKNIVASLQYLKTLTGGVIAGLPLELRLEKKPTKHGVVKIVNLVFPGDQEELIAELEKEISRRQRLQIDIHSVEIAAMTSGVTQDTDDPQDVVDEYFSSRNEDELTVQEDQADIDAEIATLHKNIVKLWNKYGINDFERTASIKKHFLCDTLEECRDRERLKEYGRTHQPQYKARKAEKEASQKKEEPETNEQEDLEFVRQRLGESGAKKLKKALLDNDTDEYKLIMHDAKGAE